MTVLIVDDDDRYRVLMQRHLGVESMTAATLIDGLRRAEEWQPAVILLDLYFPRESSAEWIGQFKSVSRRSQVVIATGYCGQEQMDHLRGLGAAAVVLKTDPRLRAIVLAARASVPYLFVQTHGLH